MRLLRTMVLLGAGVALYRKFAASREASDNDRTAGDGVGRPRPRTAPRPGRDYYASPAPPTRPATPGARQRGGRA